MEDKQLKQELATHAHTVLSKWAEGKVIHKDSRLSTEEDYLKHEVERELIHSATYSNKELPSVYTVMDDGRVEMDHPLHAPAWARARDIGEAKNFERYSRVARRLQKKLLAKGVKQEQLNDLKRFV